MFQTRTRKDDNERLTKLIAMRNDIEFDPSGAHPESRDLIIALKQFNELSSQEKAARSAEWNNYYEQVKESPIYLLFQEQRDAANKNDWRRVKDLASQARRMRENGHHITIKKPAHIDPLEFIHNAWIRSYIKIDWEIKALTKYPIYTDEARETFAE